MNVRGFLCHMVQNCLYKHGQFSTLYFALGLERRFALYAPFPIRFMQSARLRKAHRMTHTHLLLTLPVWFCLLFIGAALADPTNSASPPGVTESGAALEKLAGGFAFAEGPACDAHGNVFFTDQPNDCIHEWSTEGKLTTFLQPCGRSKRPVLRYTWRPVGLCRRGKPGLANHAG